MKVELIRQSGGAKTYQISYGRVCANLYEYTGDGSYFEYNLVVVQPHNFSTPLYDGPKPDFHGILMSSVRAISIVVSEYMKDAQALEKKAEVWDGEILNV